MLVRWYSLQITDIPSWLAGTWGISETAAQILISAIVIFTLLLPTMYLAKSSSNATVIYLFVFFLTECFLVAVGWLPYWILIVTVALAALAVAALGTDAVTGG